jgi:hypothetical protein
MAKWWGSFLNQGVSDEGQGIRDKEYEQATNQPKQPRNTLPVMGKGVEMGLSMLHLAHYGHTASC